MWKTKVGHLPTEIIEFTPLNSVEFLLLKKEITRKGTTASSNEMGGLSTPSIDHDKLNL
jgi:hypothetical protein